MIIITQPRAITESTVGIILLQLLHKVVGVNSQIQAYMQQQVELVLLFQALDLL